ncbi:MAG: DNA mismatch repair endonuclease MutL [Syntrophaceae bacterium]|nr:DNA mismatch repair endonuclease MutL [Syntrophaceae bacterium]
MACFFNRSHLKYDGCGFPLSTIRGFPLSRRIKMLDERISSRIAAGEVVERPSSIVKELIENSLDAGADHIEIELEEGGKKSIKISDNGEGIDRDEIALAFERHATSKIYEFDDIFSICSFGFRGEALPSIASISKVEMLSKRKDALYGTRAIVEGGEIKEIAEAGCPSGTSIHVRDIFYTTPVRRQFLKKESTEQAHCLDYITRLALCNTNCGIKVAANKKTVLNIPRAKDMSERISFVFGREFIKNTLLVDGKRGDASVRGLISKPGFTKSNTKGMLYYINGRFVRDGFLNHAIMTAYRGMIEARRYPSVVLYVDMPTRDVDVNVHPTKMEVRFKTPRDIYSLLVDSMVESLADTGPIAEKDYFKVPSAAGRETNLYKGRVEEAIKRYTISRDTKRGVVGDTLPIFEKDNKREERVSFSSLRYLEQIDNTYLVFSAPDRMVIMDQHAGHERVLYERLKKMSSGGHEQCQRLLIPEILDLQPGNYVLFLEKIAVLTDAGFEVEPYGENTIIIKSIPAMLAAVDLRALITDLIEEFSQTGKTGNTGEAKEKIYALMACKGAVKARQRLTNQEVERLCRDLDSAPFAATCPHGRPLFVTLDISDMERMFKRR